MVKPALVSSRNPQETVEQETAFESSKGEDFGDRTEVGEGTHPALPASKANQTTSAAEEGTLGEILRHRIRRDVGREDRSAISVAMERFAEELGDQADIKVSISRALNLFQTTGASRDVFVDCLYQARGEVLDRRAYPGKAPIPRKLMAYFFAVVEDRLGLKQPTR